MSVHQPGYAAEGRGAIAGWPVHVGVLCALASFAALWAGAHGRADVALVGYGTGAILVPVLTIVFRMQRRRAARSLYYVPHLVLERLAALAVVVGCSAGVLHAWMFATEIAKR